jgi:hypothetical protein
VAQLICKQANPYEQANPHEQANPYEQANPREPACEQARELTHEPYTSQPREE